MSDGPLSNQISVISVLHAYTWNIGSLQLKMLPLPLPLALSRIPTAIDAGVCIQYC